MIQREPRAATAATYAEARGLRLHLGLRSALDAVELRPVLLAWPAFLGYGSEAARRVMGGRLAELASGPNPGCAPTTSPPGDGPR